MDNIRTNKYGLYYVPDNQLHRPVAAKIANGGIHEPETIEYIIDNLNDKSVITAGSYFGDFLPALSKATIGTVYTFEPVLELFEYSQKTIELNKLHNVIIENKALSDKSGHVTMELFGERGDSIGKLQGEAALLGGASRVVQSASETTIEIESATLDSLISDACEISVLHLDTEGHEEQALKGAHELIKKHLPIIIVETFPRDYIVEHLMPLGYTTVKIIAGNAALEPVKIGTTSPWLDRIFIYVSETLSRLTGGSKDPGVDVTLKSAKSNDRVDSFQHASMRHHSQSLQCLP